MNNMTTSLHTYTLITGASSGLGQAFATQCAALGMDLILMALPGGNLVQYAHRLQSVYGIQAIVFECDMTDAAALSRQLDLIVRHYSVSFLINNAGAGGTVPITTSTFESMDRIMQLNMRSMVQITRSLLPHLMAQPSSYIMNIASMAAFTPIAYKTVYPASKAFVSSFSLGLRKELESSSVSVSVVYPGPIMTNSGVSDRIICQGLKGRIGLLGTATIASMALQQTLKGKAVIIPGWWNRFNYRLMQLLPLEWQLDLVSRMVKKELATA